MFKLSQRSLSRLVGVKPQLVKVVKSAIEITAVDFGVVQGVRTLAEQARLVQQGASQTMNSKHLTGDAVDLMAYIGARASWEINLYDDIAEAMRQAALMHGVSIRWGAAWNLKDIRTFDGPMKLAMQQYIDLRRSQGKRPFLDSPHFELS